MSEKDRIFDRLNLQKQSPWIPYEGPYGGEGWMNTTTGEVRYQEQRPDAEGGQMDDPEAYGAVDAESGEVWDQVPDDFGPVDWDHVDSGDPVILDEEGEDPTAFELVERNEDGTVELAYGDAEDPVDTLTADENDVLGAPAMPPPDGMEYGWQPAPDDRSELEQGQMVEVYDVDEGEYVMGEIQFEPNTPDDGFFFEVQETDEWSVDEDSAYEEGETVDVGAAGESDLLVTHTEDLGAAAYDLSELDEIAPGESFDNEQHRFGDLMDRVGETMLLHTEEDAFENKFGTDSVIAELTDYDVGADRLTFEMEDGEGFILNGKEGAEAKPTHLSNFEFYERPFDLSEPSDVPGAVSEEPEKMHWEAFTGDVAWQIDHPVHGGVEGEAEHLVTGPNGHKWLHFSDEEGGPTITTDPEHPYYAGELVEGVEDPWEKASPNKGAVMTNSSTGDQLLMEDGGVATVLSVNDVPNSPPGDPGVNVITDRGKLDREMAGKVESAKRTDTPDLPDWAAAETGVDEWQDKVDIEGNHGEDLTAEEVEFQNGDLVYYYNQESGETERGEVEEHEGDEVEIVGKDEMVDFDAVGGYVPTGSPPLPEPSAEIGEVAAGERISIAEKDPTTGEITEYEGIVTSSGHNSIYLRDDSGEVKEFRQHGDDEISVTEHERHPDYDLESDWRDDSAGDIASRVSETVDIYQMGELNRQNKERLKAEMMNHIPPHGVEEFWDHQSQSSGSWKEKSGSREAVTYEKAYKEALDIGAGTLEEKGVQPGGDPSPEMVKAAAVASELSKEKFRSMFGEQERLYRGTSNSEATTAVYNWMRDPTADEYSVGWRAIQNFATNYGTAERFEGFEESGQSTGAAVVQVDVGVEDVAATHDQLFSMSQTGETEITVQGDVGRVPGDQIEVGVSRFTNAPDLSEPVMEMESQEAMNLNTWLSDNSDAFDQQLKYADEGALRNILTIRDAMEHEHEVRTKHNSFFEKAAEEARERGMDPDSIQHPEAHDTNIELIEGVDEPSMIPEGSVVEFRAPDGKLMDGYVESVEDSPVDGWVVNIEDEETGRFYEVEPEDVEEMIDPMGTPYGEGAEYIDQTINSDELETGDRAFYDPYGSDPVQAGTIFEISGSEVKIGEPGNTEYIPFERLGPMPETDFEIGERVELDNGLPDDHPDAMNETGEIHQVMEIGGVPHYEITDDSGTTITELTAEELEEMAEPVEHEGILGDIEDEISGFADGSDDPDPEGWTENFDEEDLEVGVPVSVETSTGVVQGVYDGYDDTLGHEIDISDSEGTDPDAVSTYADTEDIQAVHTGDEDASYSAPETEEEQGETPYESEKEEALEQVDGSLTEGTKVELNDEWQESGKIPEVEIGDKVEMWGGYGTLVDVNSGLNPRVYVHDGGDHYLHEEGDVETLYPSDNVTIGGDVGADSDEGSDGEDDSMPVDPDTFQEIPENSGQDEILDTLDEGEWVAFDPGQGNYDTIVGRVTDYGSDGPGGYFEVEDAQSTGPETFPLSSYSGELDEVLSTESGGVSSAGSDDSENAQIPSEVFPSELSVGEQITLQMPHGEGAYDFTVDDVPMQGGGPAEIVNEETNEMYLLWPNGDLESV